MTIKFWSSDNFKRYFILRRAKKKHKSDFYNYLVGFSDPCLSHFFAQLIRNVVPNPHCFFLNKWKKKIKKIIKKKERRINVTLNSAYKSSYSWPTSPILSNKEKKNQQLRGEERRSIRRDWGCKYLWWWGNNVLVEWQSANRTTILSRLWLWL
jgi:hypothetical protein